VLETIERNLMDVMNKSVACQRMQYHPNLNTDATRHPPVVSFDINPRDYSGKFSIGLLTQLNTQKYANLSQSTNFKIWMLPNDVMMARVTNGCELFSHKRCNEALFFATDKSQDVDKNSLRNIEIINSRLHGITPIWAFVPNKSTAYLYPDKQFWNEAQRQFNAPNLLYMTQQAIQNKTIDLYPANNTHFSTTGYLLMGEEIFKTLQPAQPRQRTR
jgi:hypothetical protein